MDWGETGKEERIREKGELWRVWPLQCLVQMPVQRKGVGGRSQSEARNALQTRNLSSPVDLHPHTRRQHTSWPVTLTFDLLTSGSTDAEILLWGIWVPSLALIARAVFFLARGHKQWQRPSVTYSYASAAGVMQQSLPLPNVTPCWNAISGRRTLRRAKVRRPVIKVSPRHEIKSPPYKSPPGRCQVGMHTQDYVRVILHNGHGRLPFVTFWVVFEFVLLQCITNRHWRLLVQCNK